MRLLRVLLAVWGLVLGTSAPAQTAPQSRSVNRPTAFQGDKVSPIPLLPRIPQKLAVDGNIHRLELSTELKTKLVAPLTLSLADTPLKVSLPAAPAPLPIVSGLAQAAAVNAALIPQSLPKGGSDKGEFEKQSASAATLFDGRRSPNSHANPLPFFTHTKAANISLESLSKRHAFKPEMPHLKTDNDGTDSEIGKQLRGILRNAFENDEVLLKMLPSASQWYRRRGYYDERERREDEQPLAIELVRDFERSNRTTLPKQRKELLVEMLIDDRPEYQDRFFGSGKTNYPSLIGDLKSQVIRLAVGRYLLETKDRGIQLYKQFLPQFYRDYPVKLQYKFSREVNANYNHEDGNRITFEPDEVYAHSWEEHNVATPFEGPPLQQKFVALLLFLHEYAHGIFQELVPVAHDSHAGLYKAYNAVNEGFATTLELMLVDKMLAARQELGLNERDESDLKEWKRQRLFSLKNKKSHYTQGTFYFWHKIYKQGGEAAMLRILNNLDAKYLLAHDLKYSTHKENIQAGKKLINRFKKTKTNRTDRR